MKYYPNEIYHVFNQGNNKQQVFFNHNHYELFQSKIRQYILPNAHILSHCLMPNHFHLLIYMKEEGCQRSSQLKAGFLSGDIHESERYQQCMSRDISLLLRSYTMSINKQNNRSGSLFRTKTKAKQGHDDFLINSLSTNPLVAINYEQTCFNYIHQNPVKAGLVQKDVEWPYSSAQEYARNTKNGLCNKELSSKLGLIY